MPKLFKWMKVVCVASLLLAQSFPVFAGEVTVLFWPGGPEAEGMIKQIKDFNETVGKEKGITAKVIFFNRDGFFDKMAIDLAAGTDKFDLNLLTTYSLGRYAPYQEPVAQYLNPDIGKALPDSSMALMTYNGTVYGYPTDVGTHFMIYRKDLMNQLLSDSAWQAKFREISKEHLGKSLDPKSPDEWTYDDYKATALFFTKSVNPDSPIRYGTALQMKNLLFNVMIWNGVMASHGGQWLESDASTTPVIDSPESRQALDVYKFLLDKGATPKGSLNYEFAETNAAFGSGNAFSIMQWNAGYPEVTNTEKNPMVAGKVDFAALPSGPKGRRSHMHSLGLGMNKASKNKEEAGVLLRYLTSPASLEDYAKNGGTPPAPSILATIESRPEFGKFGKILAENGIVIKGGTGEHALKIYEMMAAKFSAYWSGVIDIDQTFTDVEKEMKRILVN